MKEIQSFVPSHMNNGAHFTFVSNIAERAEKDSAVSEKCKAQVKTLSLTAFVEKLKAANEEVRELTGQRTDERSAKTAGALKAARTASDEAFKMLTMHVNAHALLEGEAEYAAFIDYANTEIEHFKQEVLGGTKKKSTTSADVAE